STPSLYVYEESLDDLKELLLDGYVNSIFIVEEGYGDRVRNKDVDDLVTVISGKDDQMSVMISDIVAGAMMYEICLNKSYRLYKDSLPTNALDKQQYSDYIRKLYDSNDFAFNFEAVYKDPKVKKIEERQVTNGMIYKQMIAGMLAMLLCLMAFVSCNCFCMEYENGVAYRLESFPGSGIPKEIMDFLGIFMYTLPLSIVAGLLFADIKAVIASIVYLLILCALCTFISKAVKKTESYQLVGAVLVIGLGVLGFVSVFSGLIGGPEFLKYTPNAIYINLLV
ncbi:MAG: hypothetical protein IKH42_01220, partial [Lachnospiraceae bacterium]|nr:hypothetical protein [Lachnospiraceae bacterium]